MKNRTLVCITKNGTNPAYEGARIGVSRLAAQLGYDVAHFYPDIPDDPAEQSALILHSLNMDPAGMMVAPAHPTRTDDALHEVSAAGIPMVSFVSRSEAVAPACFVTSDNRLIAQAIADHLIAAIGGRGKVAIIEGNPDSGTSAPRTEGFLAAISSAPNISLVARAVGNYQRDQASARMAEIAAAHPDLDGVLVANDYMALGAIDALKEAGVSAKVIGINAMPQAIDALKSGELLATAAFDAMLIACASMHALDRILKGKPVADIVTLPVEIITAANSWSLDKTYDERTIPSWDDVTRV
jgi:ribose transport system substrate-binding protein